MTKRSCTLTDCSVPLPLHCMHCEQILGKGSPVEKFGGYVVVECLKCRCVTPFQLEKTA